MYVRSKLDGGKVINRSQWGAWEFCCLGAGLQHNMGKMWGPQLWTDLTVSAPNPISCSDRVLARKAEKEKEKSPEV